MTPFTATDNISWAGWMSQGRGCSPSGGKGTMLGTLIGCLLISFLRNGLTLLGVVAQIQLVAVGLIIIFAVTSDRLAAKKS